MDEAEVPSSPGPPHAPRSGASGTAKAVPRNNSKPKIKMGRYSEDRVAPSLWKDDQSVWSAVGFRYDSVAGVACSSGRDIAIELDSFRDRWFSFSESARARSRAARKSASR